MVGRLIFFLSGFAMSNAKVLLYFLSVVARRRVLNSPALLCLTTPADLVISFVS